MGREKTAIAARHARHIRVRRRVVGTPERPRLCTFRSARHIYAQVIDDARGHTLAAASTREPSLLEQSKGATKSAAAREVGKMVAERAKVKGVLQVVFDRGGNKFHGRVKQLADGAREAGLEF